MTVRRMDERRLHSRVKMEKEIEYFFIDSLFDDNKSEKKTAVIQDISLKGLSVILPEKPEIGDVIQVEVIIGGEENTSAIFCEVANTRWAETCNGFITGLDFMIIREDDRAMIEAFIVEHRKTFL